MQTKSEIVDHIILASLVQLVRQVRKGTDRDHMETQIELLRREAALERSMWGNRAGAERLEWQADLIELAAQVRLPNPGSKVASAMGDRVREQLQVMCGGLIDNSESAGAIRQAVKMALVARRVRLDDIAGVVASWEPLRDGRRDPAVRRRPILEVIEGGQSAALPRIAKFG
ncbi:MULTISPECIES: hypothetical protein [unclassified Rhizobium]|uniref:hypothetical protein n=1 Tax=unclassified Rhizobium TaxID=2613769 RepID=UPI0007EA9DEB|nr:MULTISPECIES: hypothetical protein [unclassified Rhizobium]ANL11970.1 hypothetical protein AMJ98_PA00024 [Rhizobium sp. N1341]ANM42815.1 hypothetical protein AMK03_PA00024 [Rhizobium sp. N741]